MIRRKYTYIVSYIMQFESGGYSFNHQTVYSYHKPKGGSDVIDLLIINNSKIKKDKTVILSVSLLNTTFELNK